MRKELLEIVKSCISCKNANCRSYCKLNLPINDIMSLLKNNQEEEAATLLYKCTAFPIVCGNLCDYNKKCYGHCIMNKSKMGVRFPNIEAYLGHKYLKQILYSPIFTLNYKPAIIGGGIAGLTVAIRLINQGIRPTIYDKNETLGGVLMHSLPDFRYNKDDFNKIIKFIINNADVYLGMEFGKNLFIDDLKIYDDVILALGTTKYRKSLNDKHVYQAIDLLESPKLQSTITNQKVIVVGGGNVAFDIARTMKRLNNDVIIAYRRDIKSSPASITEIKEAEAEGIFIKECVSPLDVILKDDVVTGLRVEKMELYDDGSERLNFRKTGITEIVEANVIIEALGSSPDYTYLQSIYPTIFDDKGYIVVDDNYETIPNLYVCGDYCTGASDFSSAINSAEKVSHHLINKYFTNKHITNNRVVLGGSFNPPTIAHLEMIKIIDHFSPSKIILLPNGDNYHLSYSDKSLDFFDERVKMCEEMIKDSQLNNCEILKLENDHAFKGTYYTLKELNHPAFILGSDCLFDFPKWQHYEELIRDNYFIVFSREKNVDKMISFINKEKILKEYKDHFMFINLKMSKVSSTTYRKKLNKKMLSKNVYEYIIKHNLYEVEND